MSFSLKHLEQEAIKLQGSQFLDKVKQISKNLNINHAWLLAVMYFESARTFSPSVQAPNNPNYVGLIQFGHMAAADLKTSVAELKQMTALRQLDYVESFYKMWKTRFSQKFGKPFEYKNAFDLYTSTFYPAAVGQSNSYVLGSADNTVYGVWAGNKWFDLNGDKKIEYGEFLTYCRNNLFGDFDSDTLGVGGNKKGFFLDFSRFSAFYSGLPMLLRTEIDNLINYLVSKGYIERVA